MKKSDIVKKMAGKNPHLSLSESESVVNSILGAITNSLKKQTRVEIRGFGVFSTKEKQARKSRNPKTGEAVLVDSKIVPFFKAGKLLKDKIN